ncbi:MAG: class I adenylate-forming enzyme family protein [Chthoniobacteraceae bacterium]
MPTLDFTPLLEPWQQMLARRRAATAVLSPDGSTLRTFAQIDDEARELAPRFAALAPGSIVAVQIGNSPSWPAVFLALLRGGHITLPLGADTQPPSFANALLDATLAIHPKLGTRDSRLPATALLKLTSGTTGAPRAIRFTAAQLAADCEHICATMGIGDGDVNFGVIPFAHSYGFSNLLTPLLLRGVSVVAAEDRLPRAILDGLARSGATVFPGTPVLFQHLAEIDAPSPPRLRLCISAGAPLSRAVWAKFHARFGLPLHTFYGASESGGIAYDRAGELPEEGLVGEAMDGVSVELDPFTVRSAAVGEGYFPDESPESLGGGCYRPPDLVRRGEHGLVIAGRSGDVINVGGRKLNPLEVEQCLAKFPGVRQVAVFGVPSKLRGEEPVACVAGEIDPAALQRHAASALAPWQVPRDVWLVAALPVSERGKISRQNLAAQYAARNPNLETRNPNQT